MKKLLSIVLILCWCNVHIQAQWQHTGPEGGIVKKIVMLNGVSLCVTIGGVYRSANDGQSWVMQSASLPDEVTTMITHANKFFASTTSGIFSSADGLTWVKINTGSYYLLYSNGTNILAYLNGKLHMSSNGGQYFYLSTGAYNISNNPPITAIGATLFLGTFTGVWSSNSGGAGWSSSNATVGSVTDMINLPGGALLAATSKGIYKLNGGIGPVISNSGIPAGFTASKIIRGSGKYFVTVNSLSQPFVTLYSSPDGNNWVLDNGNYPIAEYYYSDYLFNASVICNAKGIYKSTDKGQTWVTTHAGIRAQVITDMETGNGRIYASVSNRSKGTSNGGIYSSADAGATWNQLSLPDTIAVEKIIVKNNAIIAFVIEPTKATYTLYKSADEGVTWAKLTGYTNPLSDINYANNTLFITNSYLNRDIIDRSVDFGDTWQQISASGFPIVTYPLEINTTIGSTIFANIRIVINANGGLFKSADNGITWSAINNGIPGNVHIVLLTVVNNTLFAVYNSIFNGFSVLYRSTNMGANWTNVTGPIQPYSIVDVQGSDGSIFVSTSSTLYGVDSGYVFQSKDNGDSWSNVSGNLPFASMGKMKTLNGSTFVAPPGYSIWTNVEVLPVRFISIGANTKANGVQVDWKVAGEMNIRYYDVERSLDSRIFAAIGRVSATGVPTLQQNYTWHDAAHLKGRVYYRIKGVGINGEFKYTNIAKVNIGHIENGFTVAPNPVTNGVLNVQFKNQPEGKYTIRLIATNGTIAFVSSILHNNMNSIQSFYLPEGIASGNYILEIIDPEKKATTISLLLNRN